MRSSCRIALVVVQSLALALAGPAFAKKKPEPDGKSEALAYADHKCLTEGLYFEAGGEGDAGMIAVAEVIFRRAISPGFPKTVCTVVYNGAPSYGCQFSFACDGSRVRPRDPGSWKATWALAGKLLADRQAVLDTNTTLDALYFHADYIDPNWEADGLVKTVQIGHHIFYKPNGG